MTQEQKDLLLKDLCARLPYGVKFVIDNGQNNVRTLNGIREDIPYEDWQMCVFARGISAIPIEDIKPYLFPLSSMSEDLINELYNNLTELELKAINDEIEHSAVTTFEIDFYHKHHIDYRGLIPMGLAIDATGLNIY